MEYYILLCQHKRNQCKELILESHKLTKKVTNAVLNKATPRHIHQNHLFLCITNHKNLHLVLSSQNPYTILLKSINRERLYFSKYQGQLYIETLVVWLRYIHVNIIICKYKYVFSGDTGIRAMCSLQHCYCCRHCSLQSSQQQPSTDI